LSKIVDVEPCLFLHSHTASPHLIFCIDGPCHGLAAAQNNPAGRQTIPEQAKALGISEQDVIKNVMLKETADGEFTTVEDVAEAVLFLAAFGSNALTGQSLIVSHGWFME
jgi:hypothetical protein